MTDAGGKHTVSMYFVRAALSRLAPAACQRALAAAGIPPQLLAAPQARVPASAFSALWLAVARELDDEFFGLDRRPMRVGSFALICQAVLGCENLQQAIRRMLRGFALFLQDIGGTLEREGSEAVLRLDTRIDDPAARRFAEETLLTLVHGLMCWLVGRRVPLTRVEFGFARPPHVAEYLLMYSRHLGFDAPCTRIRFSARALDAPIVQTPASLRRFLREAPQSVFLKYRDTNGWTAQVRRRLRASRATAAEDWPGLEQVCEAMGTSPTTLRRRLEAEDTSFQAIKDQLRNDLAIDYLCNSALSVDEIAARLGYQDASAFHRAFRRWNGLRPGEYRRERG